MPPSSIIVIDKTSVSNDVVFNTTIHKQGAKSVCLKTTGHEKCMASICLAAKADGTKLKPFVVFRAAKRESKSIYHLGKTSARYLFVQQAIFSRPIFKSTNS